MWQNEYILKWFYSVKEAWEKRHILYDSIIHRSDHWLSADGFRGKHGLKGGIIDLLEMKVVFSILMWWCSYWCQNSQNGALRVFISHQLFLNKAFGKKKVSRSFFTIFLLFLFFLVLYYFFNYKIFNSYMRSQTWTPLPPPSP